MRRVDVVVLAAVALLASACHPPTYPRSRIVERSHVRAALPPDSTRGLRGYADYHAHMFSDLGFGGRLFAGSAFEPEDEPFATADALAPCTHSELPHVLPGIIADASGEGPHGRHGYPTFTDWPRHTTHVHQQMYLDWVHRAYRYGLRLLTVIPTNSEILCELAGHDLSCPDMDAVDRQIARLRDMVAWVRDHEGGWLGLATSPAEAEQLIRENRLAIVIGIEVDSLFRCGIGRGHACSEDEVLGQLDYYYHLGVRQITPVHLVDGAFGGAALYDERLAANNFFLRAYYVSARDCSDEGVTWRLRGTVDWRANLLASLHGWGTYAPKLSDALRRATGHCNRLGLTPLGRTLVRAMMRKGMLIDLDHMSERAVAETLGLAQGARYPVMLSHAWFRDVKLAKVEGSDPFVDEHWIDRRAEMHHPAALLRAIADLGGVVGVITNQGLVEHAGSVANDCPLSSKSFAQAYSYAATAMGRRGGVAFGSDFNGLNGQFGPRFGGDACGGEHGAPSLAEHVRQVAAQTRPVAYGRDRVDGQILDSSRTGDRVFDVNQDGLAHYGMLPDVIADLAASGMPRRELDVLFDSAAAYVRMWTLAERRAPSVP